MVERLIRSGFILVLLYKQQALLPEAQARAVDKLCSVKTITLTGPMLGARRRVDLVGNA